VVLDEISITPSKRYQAQETMRQAKQMLAQSKSGKRLDDGNVNRLQQRLMTMEKQSELVGDPSEGRQLAEELGEVRHAKLVNQALGMLAKAKKGLLPERSIEALQMRLMSMERQDQLFGREGLGEGFQLALELGEVRRSQLVAEATNMLALANRGTRPDQRVIEKVQQRLLGMEHQDEVLGRESEGKQLAVALAEVRRSQLVAEAKRVLARAKQGGKFADEHVKALQQALEGMERQDQIQGQASEGMELAVALAELRH